jgi:Fuc2NAc and GlcNAc transferase
VIMTPGILVIAIAAFVISACLTGLVRRLAISHGVLDIPNERSSHDAPTPRAGGISIVLVSTAGLSVLKVLGAIDFASFMALAPGGLAVAIVGFIDDRRPLQPRLRLVVHFAAALWAMFWLGGVPPLAFGEELVTLGWAGYALGTLLIVWGLNLFNFMDGIDGLAASEAVFIAWAAVALAVLDAGTHANPGVALVFGAACAGFLVWNWPKAKIFMGDVGSGYIGYFLVVLALAGARGSPVALFVCLILGGIFFVDATLTLLRRLARRERVQQAHRSHAYQWLARRWHSHKRVTLAVALINVVWLLPCALLAGKRPGFAVWLTMAALVPVVVAAFAAGAGRAEC